MEKYAIDTCSLINASKNYNLNKKAFEHIWGRFHELIEMGCLISTSEVLDEIKDDDLAEWSKVHYSLFLPLTEAVQKKTSEILHDYPTIIKMKSTGNSNADPFLIATAILENATIVSDERVGDEKTHDFHIPNICKKYGIECITLTEFLNRVLE